MNNPFRKKRSARKRTLVSLTTLQLVPVSRDGTEEEPITIEGQLSRGWLHYETPMEPLTHDVDYTGLRVRWAGLECLVGMNYKAKANKDCSLSIVGDLSIRLEGTYSGESGPPVKTPVVIHVWKREK